MHATALRRKWLLPKFEDGLMLNEEQALGSFAAISEGTRLRIVRMLVVAGADGLAAGAIGQQLGGATSSRLSFHLSHLERAGLVQSRREGRNIIYSAKFSALSDLVAFLMHDCCQGHCRYCDRAIALFAKCEGRPSE